MRPGEADGTNAVDRLDLNTVPELNLEALRRAWEGRSPRDLAAYPDPEATELVEALARKLGVPAEWIVVGHGSDEILGLAVRTLVPYGGRAATLNPTFAMYARFLAAHGGATVPVPEAKELPRAALRRADASVYLLASPNNPTGTAYPAAAYRALAASSPRPVVLDEAYHQFAGQDLLPLARAQPNVVVVRTFSKAYGLPGIRVGYAVGAPEIVQRLRAARPPFSVSSFSIRAALSALADDRFVTRTVARARAGRRTLARGLAGLGWKVWPSQANFLLIGPSPEAVRIHRELGRRGIWVRRIDYPGGAAGGCLRITVGSPEQIARCLGALAEVGA